VPPSAHRPHRLPRPPAVLVSVALLCSPGAGAVWAGGSDGPQHVVRISGTSEHGFHLQWSDGRQTWTPTLSETRAECSEHDTALRRSRCTAAARARYRWMGLLKRSLRAAAG
jgi:hypothetical protein